MNRRWARSFDLLHDADEVGRIRQIPIVQDEALVLHMRVFVDAVHPLGVE
jgi:hypothetical protein